MCPPLLQTQKLQSADRVDRYSPMTYVRGRRIDMTQTLYGLTKCLRYRFKSVRWARASRGVGGWVASSHPVAFNHQGGYRGVCGQVG
jgi:hypothetical protein